MRIGANQGGGSGSGGGIEGGSGPATPQLLPVRAVEAPPTRLRG
jgi:hypothetical protein